MALKHAPKHEEGLPRAKNESLDSNDLSFICAGVSNVDGYKKIFKCPMQSDLWTPGTLTIHSSHTLACKLQVFESKWSESDTFYNKKYITTGKLSHKENDSRQLVSFPRTMLVLHSVVDLEHQVKVVNSHMTE